MRSPCLWKQDIASNENAFIFQLIQFRTQFIQLINERTNIPLEFFSL